MDCQQWKIPNKILNLNMVWLSHSRAARRIQNLLQRVKIHHFWSWLVVWGREEIDLWLFYGKEKLRWNRHKNLCSSILSVVVEVIIKVKSGGWVY